MAAFTKIAIMRVFESLLSTRQVEKITVKDITDQCGISRNTFYYHYQDIYEVLKAYVDDSLDEAILFLQKGKEKDQDHICEKAVKQLESHRSLFENLMRSIKNEEVRNILDVSSKRFFDYVIDSISEEIDASPQDKELISSMCQHGVRGLMIEWLSRENASSQSLSDLLMRANYLFNGVIVMALKRSEQRSRL